MQTPGNVWIWLSEQAILLTVILAFLAFLMIVLSLSARNRRIRLSHARAGINRDTFVQALAVCGFEPEISSTVYTYLQEKQNVHFPIETTDQLDEDLGLDLVDVNQTVRDVLQLTRRQFQPGLRHTPLVTVEDLVSFVQASPRLFERAA